MQAHADWTGVYQTVKPSIPMILSNGSLCAGALIEPDLILTAAHCVNRLHAIHVSWHDNPAVFEPATIAGLNSGADVAIIKLEKPSERKPIPLIDKGQKLPEGSAIATIGHPSFGKFLGNPPFDLDSTYLISTGVVSGLTKDEVISDMSLSPGNSGGPVVNERGEIIGVVSRKGVDRYVGAIGFSAGLDKVYTLLDAYHTGKAPEVTWRNASSSAKFYVASSYQSFLEQFDGKNVWYAGLSIDFWDRWRIELADNFSRTRGFQDYATGYKFSVETANHNMIYLTPTVDLIHYQIHLDDQTEADRRVVGFGFSILTSQFPVGLKYIGFNLDGKYYGITSLHLAF